MRPATIVLGLPMLHPTGRDWLAARHRVVDVAAGQDIRGFLGGADALYAYPPLTVSADLLAAAPRLKVIAAAGSGVDHIAVEAASVRGILVTHAVGAGALSVAEHVIGLILCLAKRLVHTDGAVRAGCFEARWHGGLAEISGRTLAIVGFGAIGRELARIAKQGFGMRVLAVTPDGRDPADRHVDAVAPLSDALRAADIVSVHVPLRPSTRALIGSAELAVMKPGAWLIDTSRGGVVDPLALRRALAGGLIAGAGLDVFEPEPPAADDPLLAMPNVVLSPHDAGITAQAFERLAMAAARAMDAALRGVAPDGLVNPQIWPRSRAAPAAAATAS
ncbi:NAD(P)-dependent oxidoreductase [Chelatococcus reniformis]|uniref:Phosphoglycerate dehydrogenase n=1 Tax=Chelatococcus reniformis TaxID=1494448 RepID=A0A916XE53_9HYPH|nr:NAD(P)-dependent oxidoreductase [Chelatococcus reniformis]GGC65298.1 phosphoglycerate dehydrogenase [Chelatococcus reniformis]